MSREKQIEEMAKVMCEDCAEGEAPCRIAKSGRMCDSVWEQAVALYEAGYRKQSEGEWIVEEHPLVHDKKISCSCCGYSERRGPAWNISWGFHSYCPNCGSKMKGGAE